MRAHIVESKTRGTWQLRYSENGVRKQKQVGTVRDWPTKAEAEKSNEHLLNLYNKEVNEVPTVEALVKRYKAEEMPERKSTRRGYETWLKNYILPRWGTSKLAEMKPDPVEMWLRGLALSSKTKRNIKGILAILWTFGMKKELVPIGRNPMELVTIRKQKGEKKRPLTRSLTAEQFQALLKALELNPELRTMVIVTLSLGLRISETRALQWKDVDWLAKTISLERGVVKQDVDDVKTEDSARTMPLADGVIAVLTQWKQVSEFTLPNDWIFASPWKLGRQPVCYSWIWENLSIAGKAAGIGHLSSHAFRNAYRTWLDAMGTPVGVQQKMMRHADIRTTMNHYGTALKADMRKASDAVGRVSAGFKAS
jgi:integrase